MGRVSPIDMSVFGIQSYPKSPHILGWHVALCSTLLCFYINHVEPGEEGILSHFEYFRVVD